MLAEGLSINDAFEDTIGTRWGAQPTKECELPKKGNSPQPHSSSRGRGIVILFNLKKITTLVVSKYVIYSLCLA